MKSSNRLLTLALIIQILLTFFCPPISVGERLIFGADLWLFLWAGVFGAMLLLRDEGRKEFIAHAALSFLVIFIVFMHGYGRPSLQPLFAKYIEAPKDDLFSPGREAVVAFRFWSWYFAALVVARYSPDSKKILRALAVSASIAAISMILVTLSPEIRTSLSVLYGYNPDAIQWADRAYGIFRSPIEACATLSITFLSLLQYSNWASRSFRIATFTVIILGVLLSKTLTAFIALIAALVWVFRKKLFGKKHVLILISASVAFASFLAAIWNSPFLESKKINLMFRVKPWSIYWDLATSRWDRMLLGSGFHPHFSDSIYVFFFSRGGLFLVTAVFYLLWKKWYSRRSELLPTQNAVPIFFLISGLTIDSLILRPVVFVLVAAGIGLLSKRKA